MSLKLGINILKGWPSPYILEDSLKTAVALTQGNVVYRNSSDQWALWSGLAATAAAAIARTPYIVMVDTTDPSTGRGQYEGAAELNVYQMAVGAVHAIALNNPLEIQLATAVGSIVVGDQLSVDADGVIKKALTGDLIVGVVSRGNYSTSRCPVGTSFIHFVAENGKRAAA